MRNRIVIIVWSIFLIAPETSATMLLGTWETTFELREQMVGGFIILYAGPDYSEFQFATGTSSFDPLQAQAITITEGNGNWTGFAHKITTDSPSVLSMQWNWGGVPNNFCCVGSPQIQGVVEPFGAIVGMTLERIDLTWTPTSQPISGNNGLATGRFEAYGVVPEPSTALLVGLGLLAMGVRARRRA